MQQAYTLPVLWCKIQPQNTAGMSFFLTFLQVDQGISASGYALWVDPSWRVQLPETSSPGRGQKRLGEWVHMRDAS